MVTNLFAGTGERQFGATLENLQLNGFVASGVALASVLRVTCVVGKSMLMPARVLDEIGGFAGVRNLLAEDQVIGVRVRKAGYAIRLSHHVIENINQDRDLSWFLNRHSRWYKIRARMAPGLYLIEPATNLATVGIVWALSGDTGIAWGGLLGLLGLGIDPGCPVEPSAAGAIPTWSPSPAQPRQGPVPPAHLVRCAGEPSGQLARPSVPGGPPDATKACPNPSAGATPRPADPAVTFPPG